MKAKLANLKISTQLKLGFLIIVILVITLGAISYILTEKLHERTEIIYNHPLVTRRGISNIKISKLQIALDVKDLFNNTDVTNEGVLLRDIKLNKLNIEELIEVLKKSYLGPSSNIDSLRNNIAIWFNAIDDDIQNYKNIKKLDANEKIELDESGYKVNKDLENAISVIDEFSINKATLLYKEAEELKDSVNIYLFYLVISIILLLTTINYFIYKNIRVPLVQLTELTRKFKSGDFTARATYSSRNEFGNLSNSFNDLAESIEIKSDVEENFANLAGLMISEYELTKFFQKTIFSLASYTGSQLAAIYILSEDKKSFEHFESTGLNENARKSFAADRFEGEFGTALVTRKIQYIKDIPEDTRFEFHTVTNIFKPREIITIPIVVNNEIVAIISLASINKYTIQSIHLIEKIYITLCTRVEGILAYHKVRTFSEKLDEQYHELKIQKEEITSKSQQLLNQNSELETQKLNLIEANRLKTNFLSHMSHELRTPLNSIIALSGVLSRKFVNQIPEEEYSYLEVIERNGKHLLSLINEILDIARIEAGKEEVEVLQFDCNALIKDVLLMLSPQAKQKNIHLTQPEENNEILISTDSKKLHQILQNLVSNAIKFTESGEVKVNVNKNEDKIIISVTDTGIGISQENIKHIFDEFRQAESSTARKFGGSGLGLAIAKKYTNLLNGYIIVNSTIEKGSEFIVTLPVKYSAKIKEIDGNIETIGNTNEKRNTMQSIANVKSLNNKPTILVIDDNKDNMISVRALLQSDYIVLGALDGSTGIEMAKKHIPDLILMDVSMPGMDGIETYKIIRNDPKLTKLPIIALTASVMTNDREAVLAFGFDDYIPKPIDEKIFFQTINAVLYGK